MRVSAFLIPVILFLLFGQNVSAQNNENYSPVTIKEAKLMHSSPYQTSEEVSRDIDILRVAINRQPKSKGIFIIFCGKTCRYGEVEAHLRGLSLSLRGKGWKTEEYIALNGGFRDELTIEYWILPENACLPIPNSTIEIKDVKFKGTFKSKIVPYDCCDYR